MAEWNKANFDRLYQSIAEPWGHPPTRDPIFLHYNWHSTGRRQENHHAYLLSACAGITAGSSVVLVGCGYNWTGRGLEALGAEVVGVDTSTYILNSKDQTEEQELAEAIAAAGLDPYTYVVEENPHTTRYGVNGRLLLDYLLDGGLSTPKPKGAGRIAGEDVSTNSGRAYIHNIGQAAATHVITEEVLNSVDDGTALQVCDAAANYARTKGASGCQVMHTLSPLEPLSIQEPALNWKLYSEWRAFLDSNGFADQGLIATVTNVEHTAYGGVF